MILPGAGTRIFLATGPTDMRRGFDGLSELVRQRIESDPLNGHWFLFCNRRRNRLKVLFFDGSGLWLCQKRLERGVYSWPAGDAGSSVTLTREELTLLLGGIELERVRAKDWWRRAI
ncbi:MAG: IS66 family insertion sequence element accessory protein TnpB [Verrucomicrobia bacterium]|nr:IS66 family insertion sequence element accessory protein TnpB [Verrucomicrobiota bacterium]